MGERIKPSDPRLFQVKLKAKFDDTEEGRVRQQWARQIVSDIILLGKQRGRPPKHQDSSAIEENEK